MCQLITDEDRLVHNNLPCAFCGSKRPTGVWRGEILVHCCQTCAMEVLPVLMADALGRLSVSFVNTQGFKTIEKNFWKALCLTTRATPKV